MSNINKILHLGKPTHGDADYYKRWLEVGEVITDRETKKPINILVCDQYTNVTLRLLARYPDIKYVCTPTTGHTHLKTNLKELNIKLISLKNQHQFMKNITSVSEHTLYLMHRLAREASDNVIKLSNKKMAIIGKGRVGSYVGKVCSSMGLDVSYYDKGDNRHYLRKLFKTSDIISIHLSENKETINMIGSDLINRVKDTALLINTARSSIVNNRAIYSRIQQGSIGGFATDVGMGEMEINRNFRNLIITPHVGGRCLEDRILTDEFIINQLLKEIHGKRLQ
jgi:phosphoglycerate dehydrogenase-like enzyme